MRRASIEAAQVSEGWRRLLAVLGAAALAGAGAHAQTSAPPAPRGRLEAALLAGYRFEGSLATKADPETPVLDLGNAATFGLAVDWGFDPYADLEFQYGYTDSPATVTLPDVDPARRTYDMGIHVVTFGLLANLAPVGRPFRPYLGLGLGFTVLVPFNELTATTKFTFSIAAGIRAYLSEHFGLRFEARWAPVYLFSTGPGGYYCDLVNLECTSRNTGHVLHQTDVRLGTIFRF